jgi:NAD dependent epimerase/dehydratase family enzyme
MMRVAVTGATGLIGAKLVSELRRDRVEVTVLSRDPQRAAARLEQRSAAPATAQRHGALHAVAWDPLRDAAPIDALEGRDAVIHLAGENVAQRWSAAAKRAIRDSRVLGTRNLVAGLRACAERSGTLDDRRNDAGSSTPAAQPAAAGRPPVLVSASAIGYYGAHGEEPLDEEAPAGRDFLAQVCAAWESEARVAGELDMRTTQVRIGVVLDPDGGALEKMLPPFRLGLGGPVAGGRQFVSWVHPADIFGIVRSALNDARWSGPVNATAPDPVTNRDLSRALGHALRRPALMPVPGLALRALYGEMAQVVTRGARVLPAKPLMLGYEFRHPHLDEALSAALG